MVPSCKQREHVAPQQTTGTRRPATNNRGTVLCNKPNEPAPGSKPREPTPCNKHRKPAPCNKPKQPAPCRKPSKEPARCSKPNRAALQQTRGTGTLQQTMRAQRSEQGAGPMQQPTGRHHTANQKKMAPCNTPRKPTPGSKPNNEKRDSMGNYGRSRTPER